MPCTLKLLGFKQIIIVNEHKIRSLYHSTVFLWLAPAFSHIIRIFLYNPEHIEFSYAAFFFCFWPVSRFCTKILSLFVLAAILNKFPLSVDKSVTWFLLCMCQGLLSCRRHIGKREDPGTKLGCSSFSMFVTQWDTGYPIMLWYVQTINFGIRILSLMPIRFENLAKPNSKSDL